MRHKGGNAERTKERFFFLSLFLSLPLLRIFVLLFFELSSLCGFIQVWLHVFMRIAHSEERERDLFCFLFSFIYF